MKCCPRVIEIILLFLTYFIFAKSLHSARFKSFARFIFYLLFIRQQREERDLRITLTRHLNERKFNAWRGGRETLKVSNYYLSNIAMFLSAFNRIFLLSLSLSLTKWLHLNLTFRPLSSVESKNIIIIIIPTNAFAQPYYDVDDVIRL